MSKNLSFHSSIYSVWVFVCLFVCFFLVSNEQRQALPSVNRLAGLVVKASALGAEDPGFEFRLRRDFSGVESYQ